MKRRARRVGIFGGGGGREEVLARIFSHAGWDVFWATGNPLHAGWKYIPRCQLATPRSNSKEGLISYVKENEIDLVVIGPEGMLVDGYVDAFTKAGIPAFGPTREAARLEGSKEWAKKKMKAAGIPTASYRVFTRSKLDRAFRHVRQHFASSNDPIVIKADGLCGGKGVTVARTLAEAEEAIRNCLERDEFGSAGRKILIEEFLKPAEGLVRAEFSEYRLVIGEQYIGTPVTMDHKQIQDGDQGPNGGGSGVISHPDFVTPEIVAQVNRDIVEPLLGELADCGIEYRGVLYLGLILTDEGVKVLEFNCRFGDPELQALLGLYIIGLPEIIEAIANGQSIADLEIRWFGRRSVYVVMHAEGYPGKVLRKGPEEGDIITGLARAAGLKGVTIVHSGTTLDKSGMLVRTNGGRVIGVLATGDTRQEAVDRAYQAVNRIQWIGEHHRCDIGTWGCSTA